MNAADAMAWMEKLVSETQGNDPLPDPALIWWKAQLLERRDAEVRAMRPTDIAQWVSLIVAVLTTIVLCATNWSGMADLFAAAGIAVWFFAAAGLLVLGVALVGRAF